MAEPERVTTDPAIGGDIGEPRQTRLEFVRASVRATLERGDVAGARQLIAESFPNERSADSTEEWARLRDVSQWPDAWLVAAVRSEPPDDAALNTLVTRYWKMLFARAQLLTVNRDMADDLAQETWSRVLRARRSLDPDRNFAGYLVTIATNIWRDLHRSARRAGPLASQRLSSLDESVATAEDDVVLADAVPDLKALARDEQTLLKLDVDRALERLAPLSRDVLTARYLDGLSAAEIGKRYGRSEQTITSWIRQAVQEVRRHLEEARRSTRGQDRP